MKAFFVIMIVIGLLFIFLEWSAGRHSDSVPTSLAHLANAGAVMVAISIVGELCIWVWP